MSHASEKKATQHCACESKYVPSQFEKILMIVTEYDTDECLQNPKRVETSQPLKEFITGSSYLGTWDVLGINGEGVYTFTNGTVYKGEFRDGMFNGHGDLIYPDGTIIRGKWLDGNAYERTLIFPDTLRYVENDWNYCKMPDRRFAIEQREGLNAPDNSYKTDKQPTREIPTGYYDTGDGFYKPATHAVYDSKLTSVLRSPHIPEQKWITEHCRSAPGTRTTIGPSSHLYEEWSKPQRCEKPNPLCYVKNFARYTLENLDVPISNCGGSCKDY